MLSQQQRERLKTIGKFAILIAVTVLTAKFFLWNKWRLDQGAAMLRAIPKAPPAVNLVISDPETQRILFAQAYPANPRTNYYFVFPFDITPYFPDGKKNTGGPGIRFSVNGQTLAAPLILNPNKCTIVYARPHIFVFPKPYGSIEAFTRLRKTFPRVLERLSKKYPKQTWMQLPGSTPVKQSDQSPKTKQK